MCLIAFAWRPGPRLRLVVAANRDERHDRPAAALSPWPEAPQVIAGRDLEAGGTWLGVTRSGRFAALTAVREPGRVIELAPSRGELVAGYLAGTAAPDAWVRAAAERGQRYNGFNLLAGDPGSLWHVCNRGGPARELARGIYGLSNATLDTPWPKLEQLRRGLAEVLAGEGEPSPESLLRLLADRTVPADDELPDTGVGFERERLLGSAFIQNPVYGTRCSTVLLLREDGSGVIVERSFDSGGMPTGTVAFELARRTEAGPCPG